MKNKKTFIGVALLLAVLMLGIGYAVLSNITLNITGSATSVPSQENFEVRFTETATFDKSNANANIVVEPAVEGDLKAKVDVSNFVSKGEFITATFTVENVSAVDLSADLEVVRISEEDTNFAVTVIPTATSIAKGESTTVTVRIESLVTPINSNITGSFEFQLVAKPVQP